MWFVSKESGPLWSQGGRPRPSSQHHENLEGRNDLGTSKGHVKEDYGEDQHVARAWFRASAQ